MASITLRTHSRASGIWQTPNPKTGISTPLFKVLYSISCPSFRGQFAVTVGRCHATVHEEIAAGDKGAVRSHQQRTNVSHLIWRTGAPGGAKFDHASVALASWAGQLILCKGRDNDSRADRVDTRSALAPPYRLRHHAQRIPALGELVGMQGVHHLVRL